VGIIETADGKLDFKSDYEPSSRRAWFYRAWAVIEADVERGARDPWCNRCQGEGHLQAHHIDRDVTNNRSDNLELLCRDCHKAEHPELLDRLYPEEGQPYPAVEDQAVTA
jgi:hypothetical protein